MGAHPSTELDPDPSLNMYGYPARPWAARTTTTTSIEVLNPTARPSPSPSPVSCPRPNGLRGVRPSVLRARLPVEVRMAIYRHLFRLGERAWVRRDLVRAERAAAEVVRNLLFEAVVTTSVRSLRRWAVAAAEAGEAVRYHTRALACVSDDSAFSRAERARARQAALFDHLAGPRSLAECIPLAPLTRLPRLSRLVLQCPPPLPIRTLEELVFGTELSGAAAGEGLWDEGWARLTRLELIGPRMVLRPASVEAMGRLPRLAHLTLALPGLARGCTPHETLDTLLRAIRARAFPALARLTLVCHSKPGFVGAAPRWLDAVPAAAALAHWRCAQHVAEEDAWEDAGAHGRPAGPADSPDHHSAPGDAPPDAHTRTLAIRLVVVPDEGEPVAYFNRYLFARAVRGTGASADVDREWGIRSTAQDWTVPVRVLPLHRAPRPRRHGAHGAQDRAAPQDDSSTAALPPPGADGRPGPHGPPPSPPGEAWTVNPALLRRLEEAGQAGREGGAGPAVLPGVGPRPGVVHVPAGPLAAASPGAADLGYALARMGAPAGPPDPAMLSTVELELA